MNIRVPAVMRFSTIAEMSAFVALECARYITERLVAQPVFSLVLAGGSTPRHLYDMLAQEPYCTELPWNSIHLFWGDERFVSPDNEHSNYRMVRETLLNRVPIPDKNIHPMDTSIQSKEDSAQDYEAGIRSYFTEYGIAHSFDLALLGIGADGHTASLFPGDAAGDEPGRWVVPVNAPAGVYPAERITLTRNALGNARDVYFLTARPGKESVLSFIEQGSATLPANQITGRNTTRYFIADSL